jgi:hypothetical protein
MRQQKSGLDAVIDEHFDSDGDDDVTGEQQSMFPEDLDDIGSILMRMDPPKHVECKVIVVVKPLGDGALPTSIPLFKESMKSEFVEEMLAIAISSSYFKDRLRSVVGKPSGELQKHIGEAERVKEEKLEQARLKEEEKQNAH